VGETLGLPVADAAGRLMTRTRLLFESPMTRRPPTASIATPVGPLKDACVPMPSAKAAPAEPASVVTAPPGETRRMRLLLVSLTYTFSLAASTATPHGMLNFAFVPTPSAKPFAPCPARVVTRPPGVMARIRWFFESPT